MDGAAAYAHGQRGAGAEVDELVWTLTALSDPRATGPLTTWLTDLAQPLAVRERASRVLRTLDWGDDVAAGQLREWWSSADDLLRRHALACMSESLCPERRSAADALLRDEPIAAETRLLAALDDPDEDVVAAATSPRRAT